MARGRPCDDAGDTDLLDLDAEDEPAERGADRAGRGGGSSRWTRWPQGVPAWARGPAAAVVLVLAAAGAGAAAGSSHRSARDQESALQRALTVSDAFVASRGAGGGALSAEVHVALVNHGDAAVEVRLQGLSTPHQGTASPPEEVRVEPGGVTAAPVAVRVDCAAVRDDETVQAATDQAGVLVVDPATGATSAEGAPAVGAAGADGAAGAAAVPTVVLASVRREAGGSAVDVQLPVVGAIADSIDAQLASQCGTAERPLLETGWLWQDDGGLRVSVTARPDAAPVRLVLDSTAGLDATSDPPLPRELLPGETAVLDLQVHPRCRVVGDGALSRLDLQAVTGNGATTSLGQGFDATTRVAGTPQWLARRVALACG